MENCDALKAQRKREVLNKAQALMIQLRFFYPNREGESVGLCTSDILKEKGRL